MLAQQLQTWLDEYYPPLNGRVGAGPRRRTHRLSQTAVGLLAVALAGGDRRGDGTAVDGWRVAERVRAGRGAEKGKSLGGNPLRDVILAEAVLRGADEAKIPFQSEYRAILMSQFARIVPAIRGFEDDWWRQLDVHLRKGLATYAARPA